MKSFTIITLAILCICAAVQAGTIDDVDAAILSRNARFINFVQEQEAELLVTRAENRLRLNAKIDSTRARAESFKDPCSELVKDILNNIKSKLLKLTSDIDDSYAERKAELLNENSDIYVAAKVSAAKLRAEEASCVDLVCRGAVQTKIDHILAEPIHPLDWQVGLVFGTISIWSTDGVDDLLSELESIKEVVGCENLADD